jgi:hypothetical protein
MCPERINVKCKGINNENTWFRIQIVLDTHDSYHGKYNHIYFVNTVSSKEPKKMFFKKQIYSCPAVQLEENIQKSSTNLNPKVKCEVLTMVSSKCSFPKYISFKFSR